MKASAIELLETILEETHKETPKLVEVRRPLLLYRYVYTVYIRM